MGIFSKRQYGKKVGAMAWPAGAQPGFALVLGEEVKQTSDDQKPPVRIIAEHENHDLVKLLHWCAKQQAKHKLDTFYGETMNQPMMEFLYSLKLELSLWKAPFCDSPQALQYYVNLIKAATQPGSKTLHFGSSVIPGRLVAAGDKMSVSAQDFPALAACGYALAGLESSRNGGSRVDVAYGATGGEDVSVQQRAFLSALWTPGFDDRFGGEHGGGDWGPT